MMTINFCFLENPCYKSSQLIFFHKFVLKKILKRMDTHLKFVQSIPYEIFVDEYL